MAVENVNEDWAGERAFMVDLKVMMVKKCDPTCSDLMLKTDSKLTESRLHQIQTTST